MNRILSKVGSPHFCFHDIPVLFLFLFIFCWSHFVSLGDLCLWKTEIFREYFNDLLYTEIKAAIHSYCSFKVVPLSSQISGFSNQWSTTSQENERNRAGWHQGIFKISNASAGFCQLGPVQYFCITASRNTSQKGWTWLYQWWLWEDLKDQIWDRSSQRSGH